MSQAEIIAMIVDANRDVLIVKVRLEDGSEHSVEVTQYDLQSSDGAIDVIGRARMKASADTRRWRVVYGRGDDC